MAKTNKEQTITTFKGFHQDLTCRRFQYEIGKTYEAEGKIEACGNGFHACEYPLDVFGYYAPGASRFAVVEQSGDLSRETGGDTKVASRKIKIKAEIGLAGLIKAAVEYTFSRAKPVDPNSPASATGVRGAASATGYQGAASATGDQGAASATGDQGAASATGVRGAASATGRYSAASATGVRGKAQGIEGSALFLVYRDESGEWGEGYGRIIHAKAVIVGQDGIKPDTWYSLDADGNVVEVSE